jgi:hypothetical protein
LIELFSNVLDYCVLAYCLTRKLSRRVLEMNIVQQPSDGEYNLIIQNTLCSHDSVVGAMGRLGLAINGSSCSSFFSGRSSMQRVLAERNNSSQACRFCYMRQTSMHAYFGHTVNSTLNLHQLTFRTQWS